MNASGDLFENEHGELQLLPIPDAEVYFLQRCPLPFSDDDLFRRLSQDTPWREELVTVWGKTFKQPRLIAWYGDEGKAYAYSGITLSPLPWTPLLMSLKVLVERVSNTTFNSVLLNYYRDGRDSMGLHSDDERELGSFPTIASLSLGQQRTFVFRHRTSKLIRPVKVALQSGSLLIMKGSTQANWKHAIDKEAGALDGRINLTFRYIHA